MCLWNVICLKWLALPRVKQKVGKTKKMSKLMVIYCPCPIIDLQECILLHMFKDIQSLKIYRSRLTLNLMKLIIPQLHITKISQGSAFSNLGRLPMICGSATVPGCWKLLNESDWVRLMIVQCTKFCRRADYVLDTYKQWYSQGIACICL